jgi:hypothetical protein
MATSWRLQGPEHRIHDLAGKLKSSDEVRPLDANGLCSQFVFDPFLDLDARVCEVAGLVPVPEAGSPGLEFRHVGIESDVGGR